MVDGRRYVADDGHGIDGDGVARFSRSCCHPSPSLTCFRFVYILVFVGVEVCLKYSHHLFYADVVCDIIFVLDAAHRYTNFSVCSRLYVCVHAMRGTSEDS